MHFAPLGSSFKALQTFLEGLIQAMHGSSQGHSQECLAAGLDSWALRITCSRHCAICTLSETPNPLSPVSDL